MSLIGSAKSAVFDFSSTLANEIIKKHILIEISRLLTQNRKSHPWLPHSESDAEARGGTLVLTSAVRYEMHNITYRYWYRVALAARYSRIVPTCAKSTHGTRVRKQLVPCLEPRMGPSVSLEQRSHDIESSGDFRFWAQFIRKSVKHRGKQTNFNP